MRSTTITILIKMLVTVPVLVAMSAANADEYKDIDPKEISCSMKGYHYEGEVVKGGYVKPTGGGIKSFECKLPGQSTTKIIPLKKDKFIDGGLQTQEFGLIKVLFSQTGGFYLMARKSQMDTLKVYLADGTENLPDKPRMLEIR